MIDLNDIWNEGWVAFENGFNTITNPYIDEDRGNAWENGWFDCREYKDRTDYEALGE